jgi:hypothetical protein
MLSKIFPGNQILLLDKVYDELARFRKRQPVIDWLVREGVLTLMAFPEDNMEVKKEYAYIKKSLFKGDGESACMAVVAANYLLLRCRPMNAAMLDSSLEDKPITPSSPHPKINSEMAKSRNGEIKK